MSLSFLCAVHGFANTFDNVTEGDILDITFSLNVKGTTRHLRSVTGMIISQSDTARKLLLFFLAFGLGIHLANAVF